MDISQVSLNGSDIGLKVKVLDVPMQDAKNLLTSRKDGYDTIGTTLGDKDVLVLTKSNQKILPTDQLKINGERAEIKFIENEMMNEDTECMKNFTDQIPATVMLSAVVGAMGGHVVQSMINGLEEYAGMKGLAIGAAISVGMSLLELNTLHNECIKTDENITNSVTK